MKTVAYATLLTAVALCRVSQAQSADSCAYFFANNGGWERACGCGGHPINNQERVSCTDAEDCAFLCCAHDHYAVCQDWVDNLGTCEDGFEVTTDSDDRLCSAVCHCNATTCCEQRSATDHPPMTVATNNQFPTDGLAETCEAWAESAGGIHNACPCQYHLVHEGSDLCPEPGCSSVTCCEPDEPLVTTCQDWVDTYGSCGDLQVRDNAYLVTCESGCHCNTTLCCVEGTDTTPDLEEIEGTGSTEHEAGLYPVTAANDYGTTAHGATTDIDTAGEWLAATTAASGTTEVAVGVLQPDHEYQNAL